MNMCESFELDRCGSSYNIAKGAVLRIYVLCMHVIFIKLMLFFFMS